MAAHPRRAISGLAALFVANGTSLLGNQLTSLAIPWLVLTDLGTPLDAGIVGAGLILPAAIGAIGGGVIVDRLGRRRTSILGDVLSGATVAAIPVLYLLGLLSIPVLVILAFLGALLDAPGTTARQVLLPDLADAAAIGRERANGLYQALENIALLFGPLLAGFVVLALGPVHALWVDAVSFVACALIVAAFVPRPVARIDESEVPSDLLAGVRLLRNDRVLRALTGMAVLANFAGTPLFVVVLPAFTLSSGMDAGALGILLGAFGLGLLAGSIWFAARGAGVDRRRLLALGLAATGAGILAAAVAGSLAVAAVALVVAGAASGPINPLAFTIMQERIPDAQRGRAFGAIIGAVLLAAPIGMLAAGLVTDRTSPVLALQLIGGLFAVAGLLVMVLPVYGRFDAAVQPPAV
jgi:MFS family permease